MNYSNALVTNTLITNTDITLSSCLSKAIRKSKNIKILTAFIMESGVRLIIDDLRYAINRGASVQILTGYYLAPFNYYGIYDDTDYTKIEYKNGKYNEKELEKVLSKRKRAELVLKYYKIYGQKRTIAFCSSINHANTMAEAFNMAGIISASVHTGDGEFVQELMWKNFC